MPDAEWEVVCRWDSLVLVETPLTLVATLAKHRSSVHMGVAPRLDLHLVGAEGGAAAACWPALMAAAEGASRRQLELAAASDWLAVICHSLHPALQAKFTQWAAASACLAAEERSVRHALAIHEEECWNVLTSVVHCELAEGSQREALYRVADGEFEDLLDCCQWEMPNRQAVLFHIQLERMLSRQIGSLVAAEAWMRAELLEEQAEQQAQLTAVKAKLRRLVIMRRRYPNAPEVLGMETPMHAHLRGFRFPTSTAAPAVGDPCIDVGRFKLCDVVSDGSSDDLQCITPEDSTPESFRGVMAARKG
eukprot:GGOE01009160.1.p1 GENE.GGOE01009160.1~~GGOE01009160.1.p1  ORF type:complete len:321 (-),score=82.32 GGOE01009160.1:869-1786(-)